MSEERTDWRARYRWLRDRFQASEDGMFNWPYPMMAILSGPAFDCAVDQEIEKEAARAKPPEHSTDAERQTTDFDREFEVNGAIAIVRGYADRVALLRSAYDDAISALRYIRLHHGDLYGVGWDRLDDTYAKVYPDD